MSTGSPQEKSPPPSSRKSPQKWLQGLLLAFGGLFCITALLYVVMMVRADRATRSPSDSAASTGLDRLIAEQGHTALIAELVILGILTALIIWRDEKNA